jgi:hypothetical protein
MSLAAVVWHYWIAVPLFAMAVVGVIALIAGYAKQVTSQRFPKEPQ